MSDTTVQSKEVILLIPSLITGLTAIIAVFITAFFNSKNIKKTLETTIINEREKVKAEKIEEIYSNYMKWYAFFEIVLMKNLYYHTGKCELSDIDKLVANKKGNFGDNFTIAEMLVTLYMDETVISKFKILKNARSEVSDLFFEENRSKETYIKLSQAMKRFDSESESFKKLLSERLNIDNKPI